METKKRGRPLGTVKRHANGTSFKPGNPGGGRKKIPEDVLEMCRAASPRAIRELIAIFDDENARPGDKIRASEAILNRAWGSPRQAIDLSNGDGEPLKLIVEYASKKE